jgi:hypothetical protein
MLSVGFTQNINEQPYFVTERKRKNLLRLVEISIHLKYKYRIETDNTGRLCIKIIKIDVFLYSKYGMFW